MFHTKKKGNDTLQASNVTETMEDYLEAIQILSQEYKAVRVKHIAAKMKVKMSSVSSALSVLNKRGLVHYEKYDYVELTKKGNEIATTIIRRHETIKSFLQHILQVEDSVAENDACGMEHHVSKQTVDHILKFIEYIETCPHSENLCMKNFKLFLKSGERTPCDSDEQ